MLIILLYQNIIKGGMKPNFTPSFQITLSVFKGLYYFLSNFIITQHIRQYGREDC